MEKNNKLKQKRIINEDMSYIRNMIIILVVVVFIVIGLYFITERLVNKDNNTIEKVDVKIDYDIATIGTMFNRIEDTYYVLIYSSSLYSNELDETLLDYRSSDNYIKTYYIDLDKKINSIASGDTTVKYPTNSNEVKVNEPVLYKISNNKVVSSYIGVSEIESILK